MHAHTHTQYIAKAQYMWAIVINNYLHSNYVGWNPGLSIYNSFYLG